jgi:hypothetical protein
MSMWRCGRRVCVYSYPLSVGSATTHVLARHLVSPPRLDLDSQPSRHAAKPRSMRAKTSRSAFGIPRAAFVGTGRRLGEHI